MAILVRSSLEHIKVALEQALASAERQKKTARNPKFAALYELDIQAYQQALGTLQEVPDEEPKKAR